MGNLKEFQAVFVRFGVKAGKSYLYIAPYEVRLDEGDTVVIEHSDGEEGQASVVYADSIDLAYSSHRDKWEAYQKISGVDSEEVKRIKAVIRRTDFIYHEEEETEDDE